MVDPTNFTRFDLNGAGLQEYVLFAIGVAGKPALTTARLLDKLLKMKPKAKPFNSIKAFGSESVLREKMKSVGFGCYNLKARGFWDIANSGIDLKTCTSDDLEKCYGIGMKTSRFFIMHTREYGPAVACLDTHILHFMRDEGFDNIPKQTPSKKEYLRIEKEYLDLCEKRGKHPAHYDLEIWRKYSGN